MQLSCACSGNSVCSI
uniref:Uncharacterized protein n=1 Tax=Anguilla anguilla TaxID=7936 RepID=A0A0E9TR45_ANGAN